MLHPRLPIYRLAEQREGTAKTIQTVTVLCTTSDNFWELSVMHGVNCNLQRDSDRLHAFFRTL